MKFTIPIAPKAKKRARSRAFVIKGGGKLGQDIARAQTYTDADQRTEQNRLMALMYEHRPPGLLQGALVMGVKTYLPIPKSKPKKWQAAALAGEIRPTTKPDSDNLIKQVKDCANRVFWEDDKQVVEYLPGTGKYYDDGGGSRWEIEIVTLEEYRAGLVERYQGLLGKLVGEPQGILAPGLKPIYGIDAFGPSVSSGKGKVSLETQQGTGRLF